MISLSEFKDGKLTEDLFAASGLKRNESSSCVVAKENGNVIGYCIFDIDNDKIVIRHISPQNDILLADGILRSTLHVAAERFVMDAFYESGVSEELLDRLEFILDKQEKRLDMDKLFKSCCTCGSGGEE